MYITQFGPIDPMSLLRKKGARLATLLKQDMMTAPTLKYAIKLYDQVYRQLDEMLYGLNESHAMDNTGVGEVMSARDEIEDFFEIMSGKDVFDAVWRLDRERGNTGLFRDIDYNQGQQLFPIMMRFFDLFHGSEFTNARSRINEAIDSQDYEQFILGSLGKIELAQDAASFARMRSHYGSKYRGFRRMARYFNTQKKKKY